MRNKKHTQTMTKFQEKVQKMEMRNRMMNPFRNEILFSDMGMENHLQNVLYGVWNEEFETEEYPLF